MVSLRAPGLIFSLKSDRGENEWPSGIAITKMNKYYERSEKKIYVQQIPEEGIPITCHVFTKLMQKCNYTVDRVRYALKKCQNSGCCITGCA